MMKTLGFISFPQRVIFSAFRHKSERVKDKISLPEEGSYLSKQWGIRKRGLSALIKTTLKPTVKHTMIFSCINVIHSFLISL